MLNAHESLAAALDGYPRLPLAEYPTPLDPLPRLSRDMGRPIYIKRDDQIGPGTGRKQDAQAGIPAGRRQSTGRPQSRHFRRIAVQPRPDHCRRRPPVCGLEPHLFYFARRPAHLTGNLLLNQLLGAHMHFIPFGGGGDGSMTWKRTIRLVRLVARASSGGIISSRWVGTRGGVAWATCVRPSKLTAKPGRWA